MRTVVGVIFIFSIGIGVCYTIISREVLSDQGHMFRVVFGIPKGGDMQMHVSIPPMIAHKDPPRVNSRGVSLWKDWVADHFQILDESGQSIRLQRLGTSGLLGDQSGASDFALWTELKQGKSYTMDFVPIRDEENRYRFAFEVPVEATKPYFTTFEPVEEEG